MLTLFCEEIPEVAIPEVAIPEVAMRVLISVIHIACYRLRGNFRHVSLR